MYQIFKLLKGSIAFNIFVGVVTLYAVWWLVTQLGMTLLSAVLDQFVKVGVIVLIIIFQPEVRRFLLFLGNSTLSQRSNVIARFFARNVESQQEKHTSVEILKNSLIAMAKHREGALIILSKDAILDSQIHSGVFMDAQITEGLLRSIFNKQGPLHDGAVIIESGRVHQASVILPVSERSDLPEKAGLRHRSGVGITEHSDVASIIVSEERGEISLAKNGLLFMGVDEVQLSEFLKEHL